METNAPSPSIIKRRITFWAICTGVVVLIALVYSLLAAIGRVPVNGFIFWAWGVAMEIPNLFFTYHFWKNRRLFKISTQIFILLWNGACQWWWVAAPVYHLLTMNVNSLQTGIIMFAYYWEVIVIASIIFSYISYWQFKPYSDYFERGIKPKNPETFYRGLLRFPLIIIIWTFIGSILGYFTGGLQLSLLGDGPRFELIKNTVNGVGVGVFLALIYYLLIDLLLSDIRKKLRTEYPSLNLIKRKLTRKVAGVSLFAAVGIILFVGLITVRGFQGVVRENVVLQMDKLIPLAKTQFELAKTEEGRHEALQIFRYGTFGRIFVIPEDAVRTSTLFSQETEQFIATHDEGSVQDLRSEIKLVSFFKIPSENIVVFSLTELPELYWSFFNPLNTFAIGIAFALLLSFITTLFISEAVTRSIRTVSLFIRSLSDHTGAPHELNVYTGDEIQELAQTLGTYVEEVQTMDKAKNDFILLASHQLRTPPTMIRGYAELLLDQGSNLTPQQKEQVERIYRNNQRIIDLVNMLVNVSSMELGIVKMTITPVDPATVVKGVLDELEPAILEKHIILGQEYETVPQIPADAQLLRIVLHNLLSNALHYTPDSGHITVGIAQKKQGERIGERDIKEESLIFSVADTGYGIPKDAQEKLFTKFFRAENAKKVHTRGTGLGLYMTKSIMTSAGGDVWFVSQEGKGTTFYLSLPIGGMKPEEQKKV